jgi:hypothetical protein
MFAGFIPIAADECHPRAFITPHRQQCLEPPEHQSAVLSVLNVECGAESVGIAMESAGQSRGLAMV